MQPGKLWGISQEKLGSRLMLMLLTFSPVGAQPSEEISFRKHTLDPGRNET